MLALTAHFVVAMCAPSLVRRMGRNAFLLLAIPPAATAVLIASLGPRVLSGSPVTEAYPWIPQLQMSLTLQLDALAWVFTLIVSGVGTLILLFCSRYFTSSEPGLGLFAGVLLAFAGAMAGLVLSDDVMLLFIFWELTTVFSYLLIGHYLTKQASRRAAMNALISTTVGGLAMMVGLIWAGMTAGSFLLSDILREPASMPVIALILLLVGAAAKSAIAPGHFWLPGAMAAPTPVSAYLHAAAMVKAGIYLIMRCAPVLQLHHTIALVLAAFGIATMILGGWRALRQTDIKLLLAYGTVSQLGFMTAVTAFGTPHAVFAGLALVISHALFKAPLFMVVGIIDKSYGTRDITRLHGVGRDSPMLALTAVLAAGSMAAIPPLFGFIAKEAVFAALHEVGGAGWLLLAGAVAGSMLTIAYAWRFIAGVFPGAEGILHRGTPPGFLAPPLLLVIASVLLIPFAGPCARVLAVASDEEFPLSAIPHLGVPLYASLAAIAGGVLLIAAAAPVERFQAAVSPQRWKYGHFVDAEKGFRALMRATDLMSVQVTALMQRGSLPLNLSIIFIVLIALSGGLILRADGPPSTIVWFHHWSELCIAVLAIGAGIAGARARRRMRATLLISGTGFAVALLFMTAGAPDVAVTQLLVETILTVVLVLVLRRLPLHFSIRPLRTDQLSRWIIAIGTAITVCLLAAYAAGARQAVPTGPSMVEPAYTIGGGHNVVNVALVDARVWDTMGEISVLLVVAAGVASLLFLLKPENHLVRMRDLDDSATVWRFNADSTLPDAIVNFDAISPDSDSSRGRTWISAGSTLAPERRMVVLEVITRFAFPIMMLFSVYLLLAGHNLPGGGFAGGLVAGLALTLRYLAGGRVELVEAMPVQAGWLLGSGMSIAVLSGAAPLLWGGSIFDSVVAHVQLPLFGEVELASAMVFDLGVYLVVLGLVLDVLRALGEQIDRHQEAEQHAD